MEKVKVLILTEGSKDIGFGHITRCLSIYQAFEERGIKPFFVIYGDSTVEGVLKGVPFKVLSWFENLTGLEEILRDTDIAVVDSYKAPLEVYKLISKTVKVPLYIDDFGRLDYPKGVVLNATVGAQNFPYPRREGVKYLLGVRYIPLRRPFWDVPKRETRKEVKNVLITFGGDDLRSMTPEVLKLLNTRFGKLKKLVVVGGGFKKETVREIELLKDQNTELFFNLSAEGMRDLMLKADVSISAGGQTLYELARTGTPTVAVGVADNQKYNLQNWAELGFIEFAGFWNERNIENRILESFKRLLPLEERVKRSQVGQSLVDGQGARRVVQYLLSEV